MHFTVKTIAGETAHVVSSCPACESGRHDDCVQGWYVGAPRKNDAHPVPGPALYRCRCYAFGRCASKQQPPPWRWFGWLRKQKEWRLG